MVQITLQHTPCLYIKVQLESKQQIRVQQNRSKSRWPYLSLQIKIHLVYRLQIKVQLLEQIKFQLEKQIKVCFTSNFNPCCIKHDSIVNGNSEYTVLSHGVVGSYNFEFSCITNNKSQYSLAFLSQCSFEFKVEIKDSQNFS